MTIETIRLFFSTYSCHAKTSKFVAYCTQKFEVLNYQLLFNHQSIPC